jgi:hypothetical protein
MSLFAIIFLIAIAPKDNVTSLICNYVRGYDLFARMCPNLPLSSSSSASGEFVASRIISACLDRPGLRLSIAFDKPIAGASNIQVFTTGDDYFPSEQGISDSFRMSMIVPSAVDNLDFMIPVDAMPVGEQIFGNFFISDEAASSFVAYSMNVTDCSITATPPIGSTPNDIPTINSATCLPSRHLMIAFEFENQVLGQYRALVADVPYQLASVINQPATLFFSGEAPPAGPVVIKLISATDEVIVFEETYTPPVCGGT